MQLLLLLLQPRRLLLLLLLLQRDGYRWLVPIHEAEEVVLVVGVGAIASRYQCFNRTGGQELVAVVVAVVAESAEEEDEEDQLRDECCEGRPK